MKYKKHLERCYPELSSWKLPFLFTGLPRHAAELKPPLKAASGGVTSLGVKVPVGRKKVGDRSLRVMLLLLLLRRAPGGLLTRGAGGYQGIGEGL